MEKGEEEVNRERGPEVNRTLRKGIKRGQDPGRLRRAQVHK